MSGLFKLTLMIAWLPGAFSGNWKPAWKIEDFPNPRVDVSQCGRNFQESWVCDPSNILSSIQADNIDRAIESTQSRLDCPCRRCNNPYPIGVALVPRIDDGRGRPMTDPSRRESYTRQFARYLRDVSWAFGDCEDDIIIVVSRDDRQIYTALGDTTLKKLSARCTQDVYRESRKYFSRNQYYDGIRYMVSEYRKILSGTRPCVTSGGGSWQGWMMAPILIGVFLLICCCGGLCCFCRQRKGQSFNLGGGGGGGGGWGGGRSHGYNHNNYPHDHHHGGHGSPHHGGHVSHHGNSWGGGHDGSGGGSSSGGGDGGGGGF